MSGHCEPKYQFTRYGNDCTGLDSCVVKDITTLEQCQQLCEENENNCEGIAFGNFVQLHCIIYPECTDSGTTGDFEQWGMTYLMKGEKSN